MIVARALTKHHRKNGVVPRPCAAGAQCPERGGLPHPPVDPEERRRRLAAGAGLGWPWAALDSPPLRGRSRQPGRLSRRGDA
jgi:hypothetical protein